MSSEEESEGENVEEKEVPKEEEELFKEHSFNEEQIEMYHTLKKEFDLSPERIVWLINSKRRLEICRIVGPKYVETVKEFKMDREFNCQEMYDNDEYYKKLIDTKTLFFSRSRANNIGCIYFNTGNHKIPKNKREREIWMYHLLIVFEKLMRIDPGNSKEGIYFITDFKKFGYSKFDTTMIMEVSKLLLKIPIRMRSCICFDYPWWFSTVLAVIKPFFHGVVMKRFKLIKRKELLKMISKELLIEEKGGDFKFDYDEWLEKEMKIIRKK